MFDATLEKSIKISPSSCPSKRSSIYIVKCNVGSLKYLHLIALIYSASTFEEISFLGRNLRNFGRLKGFFKEFQKLKEF